MGEACSTYLSPVAKGKLHTGFWRGDMREKDHLRYLVVDGRMILKWIFMEWDGGMIRLRIGTGGGHL